MGGTGEVQDSSIKVLDHGYVKLIETWGSDERIIESARMSTSKGFQGWGTVEKPGDEKLLRYLYEHKHMTPFEMAGAIIEVQAPIFVFREWHRHRTQSYNELSARYTELPNLFYHPSIERIMAGKQGTKNKQGSEGGFTYEEASRILGELMTSYSDTRNIYQRLLGDGVAREIARLVIPGAQYSKMRASANLRNWMGFLSLRLEKSAQFEIRQYANEVFNILSYNFPRTLALFEDGFHG